MNIYGHCRAASAASSAFRYLVITIFYCSGPMIFLFASSQNTTDFVINGSFEDGIFDPASGNFLDIAAPSDYIPGWYISAGTVDWVRGRWKPSTDGSPSCIDLNGIDAGIMTTALASGLRETLTYSVVFDAGANPDNGAGLQASFQLAVVDSIGIVLNLSVFNTTSSEFIFSGWTTFGDFLFTASGSFPVNLTFKSLIDGEYGPLLDNVRVFQVFNVERSPPPLPDSSTTAAGPTTVAEARKNISRYAIELVSTILAFLLLFCVVVVFALWRLKNRIRSGFDRRPEDVQQIPIASRKCYTLQEVRQMTDGFRKELGRGAQGIVYLAVLPDGRQAAVKCIKKVNLTLKPISESGEAREAQQAAREAQQALRTELELLLRLHHRNLVSLLGFCMEGSEIMLLFEFMENGTLAMHLHESTSVLNWNVRLRIALEVAQALEYLHSFATPPLVHRDIKSTNILLDEGMRAKVADFGLSKESERSRSMVSMVTMAKGTIGYMDPDYVRSHRLTEKSDVYSYGVLMLEIVTGREVIDKESFINIVEWFKESKVVENPGKLWDRRLNRESGNVMQLRTLAILAAECVAEQPVDRPSMSDVVRSLTNILPSTILHS